MAQKFKLDNKEYDAENLSDQAKAAVTSMRFAISRIEEINNMQALLQRAKNSYIDSLKKEVISKKSGLLIDND